MLRRIALVTGAIVLVGALALAQSSRLKPHYADGAEPIPTTQVVASTTESHHTHVMSPLDPDGNVKTASQVRDEIIDLIDTPVVLVHPGDPWVSDTFEIGWATDALVKARHTVDTAAQSGGIQCTLEAELGDGDWYPGPPAVILCANNCAGSSGPFTTVNRTDTIWGRSGRIVCSGGSGGDPRQVTVSDIKVYLRAE